jgi:hypothetical protein
MMRNNSLFSLLFVFAVVLLVLGFMRGWFVFTSAQRPSGKVNMELSIDPNKAQSDAKKARQRAGEFFDKVRSEVEHPEAAPPAP